MRFFIIYFTLICFSDLKANIYSEKAKIAEKELEPISSFRKISGVVKAYDPEKNIAYYAKINHYSFFNVIYIAILSSMYFVFCDSLSHSILSIFEHPFVSMINIILSPLFIVYLKFMLSPFLYLTADSWSY